MHYVLDQGSKETACGLLVAGLSVDDLTDAPIYVTCRQCMGLPGGI